MSDQSTRGRIVSAADKLFYEQGFEHTSFADIADAVQISRGNFYHHFKAKDEILDAVIELRLENTRQMLDDWEREGATPKDRIACFIKIVMTNWASIRNFGCPVGTLTAELSKLDHASHEDAAKIFSLFKGWLRKQFTLLGHKKDADELALHLLVFSQGVAAVGSAFHDEKFVRQQVEQMCDWLEALDVPTGTRRQTRSAARS